MTLDTRIRVLDPVPVRDLFRHCQTLLGDPDRMTVRDDRPDWLTASRIQNDPDQGLDAWLRVFYGDDGPLPRDPDGDNRPEAVIEVSFDTSYSYHGRRGGGCEDLHAWLVQQTGIWLDDRRARWLWCLEETGEWYRGCDIDDLGDPVKGCLS